MKNKKNNNMKNIEIFKITDYGNKSSIGVVQAPSVRECKESSGWKFIMKYLEKKEGIKMGWCSTWWSYQDGYGILNIAGNHIEMKSFAFRETHRDVYSDLDP